MFVLNGAVPGGLLKNVDQIVPSLLKTSPVVSIESKIVFCLLLYFFIHAGRRVSGKLPLKSMLLIT